MSKDKKNEKDIIDSESLEIILVEGAEKSVEGINESRLENENDKKETDNLRKNIEDMDLEENLKEQVSVHTQNSQSFDDEKKLKYLLELVKDKGVVFAVKVAQKLNNPYILDRLHDILTDKGYYKDFVK